ncbi:MAG: hypothetical protein AAF587_44655, partial [Bacteroidota bacterium]
TGGYEIDIFLMAMYIGIDIFSVHLKRTRVRPPPPFTNSVRFEKNIGIYGRSLRRCEIIATLARSGKTTGEIVQITGYNKMQVRQGK